MKNQAVKPSSRRWNMLGPVIGVTVLLTLLAIYVMQPEPEPPATPSTAAKENKTPPRFGPGVLPESTLEPTIPGDAAADPEAPPGLAVTADQRLLINKEMRDVFDYFLMAGRVPDRSTRMARLHAHMKAKLPPDAYSEAAQIASNYLAYLSAFEKLMADELNRPRSDPGSPMANPDDSERISARIVQISQLRQSMLGTRIAQLWYAEEEAGTQQSLAEMRQLNANPQQPNIR
jgi:hypothetical protein